MGEQPPVLPSNIPAVTSLGGSFSLTSTPVTSPQGKKLDWTVTSSDKAKYDTLFDSLNPVNERLPGFKVKEVLMNSKLPVDMLGKIWDLADIDHDGALSRHEFTVAMHLVYKVLDNYPIPVGLPPELYPPPVNLGIQKGPSLPGAVPVLPSLTHSSDSFQTQNNSIKETISNNPQTLSSTSWIVGESDRVKFDALFIQADLDKDGYVSGMEIKDVFLQSGLPQPVLAHIWNLCDIGQTGKLNAEQFALAMWMVQQKVNGRELPNALSPDMIPPSLRLKETNSEDLIHTAELEQIAKEIETLVVEKRVLEAEIAQKEADIKIKHGEVRSLQSELDTLVATLKQLENQKKEAQKRLDDLDTQRSALEQDLQGVARQIEEHEKQVRTFRTQAEEQEKVLRTQEAEVAAKKQELSDLRNEELRMEQQTQATRAQLDKLQNTMQDTQLNITQIKARISVLQEQQNEINDALAAYEEALTNGDATQLNDSVLHAITLNVSENDLFPSPISERAKFNGGSPQIDDGAFHRDPFSSLNGPVRGFTAPTNGDPFAGSDFFAEGAIKSHSSTVSSDPFASKDPFGSAFGTTTKPTNDPFAAAFGQVNEPFNAFGGSKSITGTDPFGSDPFTAMTTSSSTRVESPTPALPPKKSKQPPPRPAPPKGAGPSAKGPQRPAPPVAASSKSPNSDPFAPFNDPFAAPASASKDPFAGSGFADFASFETKFTGPTSENSIDAWGSSTKTTATQEHRYAELEFTEDPFKDVGFGDPFDVTGDDPFTLPSTTSSPGKKKNDNSFDPFNQEKDPFSSPRSKADFDSAFSTSSVWNGRSDPFSPADSKSPGLSDEFKFSPNNSHGKSPVPVASSTLKNKTLKTKDFVNDPIPKLTEEAQLAWAARESVRLEEERRRKAELQEKADLEMAIALSKSEMGNPLTPQDRLI
nr:EOG090X01QX [Cyclestheria hislopi]